MKNKSLLYNFTNFFDDKQFSKLIKEANLVASEDFLDRLNSMSNNNIASKLADAFSKNQFIDKNLNYNWIDVTDQDGMITFTSDRNAERLGNDSSQIWSSKRQPYSVGKLARAILPEIGYKISNDKEIEDFVNLYKASKVDTSKNFEIVEGPIIKEYYKENSYSHSTGSLGKSCMRYDKCQPFFKIYTKNAPVCRMLIYLDENKKVLGRALIWKLYKTELFENPDKSYEAQPEFFMDRVYTVNESDVIKFTDYAKKNNWLVKFKMSASNQESLQFSHNGKWVFGRIYVKLPRLHFDEYPYVDTLKFSDGNDLISNVGFWINTEEPDHDLGFVLNNTDGRATYCVGCDGDGHEKDQSGKCKTCKGKKSVICFECDGSSLIVCRECRATGSEQCATCQSTGEVACRTCKGQGKAQCLGCEGKGLSECQICGGSGDLGECSECESGKVVCTTCDDKPYECSVCFGEGGSYDEEEEEFKACKSCGGSGSGREGTNRVDGCRCPDCSVDLRGGRWMNQGYWSCDKCEGSGKMICPVNCNRGYVECDVCDGKGTYMCDECDGDGLIGCETCHGEGNTGPCKKCKGEKHLGPCSCQNGRVPCQDCSSSGVRGKLSNAEYKCSECAGLLEDFIVKKYPEKRIN